MLACIQKTGLPNVLKFIFPMVQKQDGHHFALFSNGPDHWKTERTASLDYFIHQYDYSLYIKPSRLANSLVFQWSGSLPISYLSIWIDIIRNSFRSSRSSIVEGFMVAHKSTYLTQEK